MVGKRDLYNYLNEHEIPHSGNEEDNHMNSINHETNVYKQELVLLTISHHIVECFTSYEKWVPREKKLKKLSK